MILCTFRYYDPANGRWLNRDPIGYGGGVNLYGYCTNNPVMGMDPLGLQTFSSAVPADTPMGYGGGDLPGWHTGEPREVYHHFDPLGDAAQWCADNPWEAAAFAAAAIDGIGEFAAADAAIEGSLSLAGEAEAAAGATRGPVMPLGLSKSADGATPWFDMRERLLEQGARVRMYPNPQTALDSIEPGVQMHFNLRGFDPSYTGSGNNWTLQEWQKILDYPELHPATTVYNVPKGMNIPSTINNPGIDF